MTASASPTGSRAAGLERAAPTPASDALVDRYGAYRLEQGRHLLGLVPREGLRALVRACGTGAATSLEELAAFCADLLPLPPLEVWMRDFRDHTEAHLAGVGPAEAGPRSPDGTPVTVAVRHFRSGGTEWVGQLQVQPRDDRWEGSIQFHRPGVERGWRTAPVFREDSVPAIRERFGIFDDSTLAAFLRSALP